MATEQAKAPYNFEAHGLVADDIYPVSEHS